MKQTLLTTLALAISATENKQSCNIVDKYNKVQYNTKYKQ